MHRVGSVYTRSINEKLSSDGPIFRGRFRSLVCDTPDYVDNVGRYIHRNPIELRPESPLADWWWSSYPAYIGVAPTPNWLTTSTLLGWHGDRASFRDFVDEGPNDDVSNAELGTVDITRWQWAIATAVAEFDLAHSTDVSRNIDRAATLGLADVVAGDIGEHLRNSLMFPTRTARNSAVNRVRRRIETGDSEVQLVIERAIHLAKQRSTVREVSANPITPGAWHQALSGFGEAEVDLAG